MALAIGFPVLPHALPGLAVTVIQAATCFANFGAGGTTPYGRFFNPAAKDPEAKPVAAPASLPSQTGMVLLYAPAFAVGAWFALSAAAAVGDSAGISAAAAGNGRELACGAMVALHFFKRLVEVACVHVYSGRMDRATAFGIGTYYALMAWLVLHQQAAVPASALASGVPLAAALGVFAAGEAGNGWHHWRLAQLRPKGGPAAYALPSGGLFDSVVSPHYLFEVVAWVGIALASGHVSAWLLAVSMATYLAGRADATWHWYAEKFGADFPTDRGRMFPGIF